MAADQIVEITHVDVFLIHILCNAAAPRKELPFGCFLDNDLSERDGVNSVYMNIWDPILTIPRHDASFLTAA